MSASASISLLLLSSDRYCVSVSSTVCTSPSSSFITYNAWVHLAVVRKSTVVSLYINGVADAVTTTVTDTGASPSTFTLYVGGKGWQASSFTGYMTSIRAVAGTAVYTSNVVLTRLPLSAIRGTQLLLLTASADTLLIDSSTASLVFANPNKATYAGFSPFTGT